MLAKILFLALNRIKSTNGLRIILVEVLAKATLERVWYQCLWGLIGAIEIVVWCYSGVYHTFRILIYQSVWYNTRFRRKWFISKDALLKNLRWRS